MCDPLLLEHIPPRPAGANSVAEFVRASASLDDDERELLIRAELLAGNLPDSLRRVFPVRITAKTSRQPAPQITLCVLSDYLAIGPDGNSLIAPMRLATALSIAKHFGFLLPTPTMVDAIYAQARLQLKPQPMPAGAWMRSTDYYLWHNALIVAQRAALGRIDDVLVAGHKKDLVLTNRLWVHPERVAIYGWQHPGGDPIQPLSTVHGARYADYSHGVRLVSEIAYVDGRARRLIELLEDADFASALNSEGPLRRTLALVDRLASGVDSVRTTRARIASTD